MRLYHSDQSFHCITASTVLIDTCFFRYLAPKKLISANMEIANILLVCVIPPWCRFGENSRYLITCLLTKAWHFRLKNSFPIKSTNWNTIIFSFQCLKLNYQSQVKDSNTFHQNLFHDLFQQRYRKVVKNISCRQHFNTKFEKLNWI